MQSKGPRRRLGRRLEEVAKAVGGGYRRLQMPLRLALGVRGTVGGRRLSALERWGGGGSDLPPSDASLGTPPAHPPPCACPSSPPPSSALAST